MKIIRGLSIPGLLLCASVCLLSMQADAQTLTTIKSFGDLANSSGWRPLGQLVQGQDGALYGTTSKGEGGLAGTVFAIQPDGSGFTVLKRFMGGLEGSNLQSGLVVTGNVLYGTTYSGGTSNYGTIFRMNTDGTGYTVLKYFDGFDGANPQGDLTLSGNVLYGTTQNGSNSTLIGTVFRVNTDGTGFQVLKHINVHIDGGFRFPGVILSDGVLYGIRYGGSSFPGGTLFKLNTDGTGYTVIKDFTQAEGGRPFGELIVSGDVLYGTTGEGGTNSVGTVFKIKTDGTGFTVLKHLSLSGGSRPFSRLTLSGNVLYGTTTVGGRISLFQSGTIFKLNTDGTGYTVLKDFDNSGDRPYAGLLLFGNVLYGTTSEGNGLDGGTLFKVNTDGSNYTVLKEFGYGEGINPFAGVTVSGNELYGTLRAGGTAGYGEVFKVKTDGTSYTTIKHFSITNGARPYGRVVISGEVLYGTAEQGGDFNRGTVFKARTDGMGYTVLKHFTSDAGARPLAGLILAGDMLYGTTDGGPDAVGSGTVFKLHTDGTGYSVLKTFSVRSQNPLTGISTNTDGASPQAELTLSGSVLYGTASSGGTNGYGTVFKLNTDGTDFTVLKHFGRTNGANPRAELTVSDGVLYGTTAGAGAVNAFTVFKLNTDGTGYAVLKYFQGSDGAPYGGLILRSNVLYGTTRGGGKWNRGSVFKLNTDGTGFAVIGELNPKDGMSSYGTLALSGNILYGTTVEGGTSGFGTVFRVDLSAMNWAAGTNTMILNWADWLYSLQSASAVTGPFTNVPSATSPHTNSVAGPQQFFRLKEN